ncbi:MAG: nucleotidyltransferase family protein [Dehalococcoidia bacterium]
MPFVSAILLAAGESRRMGRQKALLPWQRTTLLEYHLAQLAAVDEIREIIVVTGHEPERITQIAASAPRARVVHNAAYRTGKVSSIQAGLRAVSPDAGTVLLLAVDQPRPSSVLRSIVERHLAAHPAITVPTSEAHRGHPVLFDRSLLAELLEISEDTQGVRAIMQQNAGVVLEVELSDPVVNLDLNTPSDLENDAAGASARRSRVAR